ncbi:hypothetical protein ES677_13860 [Bizionia gelidisalsuginis]|uniref:Uncharacterized protein n=2 Tax=Bizionia TaxID=283785 RepID=A0A8H2QIA7_9FLAO|nr:MULTISPECIES: hypothetical protein [Bizionia]TYB69445.1 hypothetical protein ES676_14195 [Bizionia saleffrena]TYC08845.1 hypothetical protein ES677_13860 [Bizionia gelidisalsuginis]
MKTELIKLKLKANSSTGETALHIKNTFIKACESLDTSIFEPLIEEDQNFQDLDKYRFLKSMKVVFDSCKEKGFKQTTMIKGHCESCYCDHKVYQFYTNQLVPAFAYIIHEENSQIEDIFACNLSSGMRVVEMGNLLNYDFWK